ncbi:hypothetical protein I4U23_011179 [Adineta vaga]|nr:hypothetical protein I4U23_011179 [Adineta vaga]
MSVSLVTTIEQFSNELFIEIFDYLDGYRLVCAFYELNKCLSTLVDYFKIKYIDSRHIEHQDCRSILTMINPEHLISLKISYTTSDEQIKQLFDNGLNNLRSLTLDSIPNQYDEKTHAAYTWLFERNLSYFQSLKYFIIHKDGAGDLHDQIFHSLFGYRLKSSLKRKKYQSLKHLSLPSTSIFEFSTFLSSLSNLQTLEAGTKLDANTTIYPMMRYIKRCQLQIYDSSFELIANFLSYCPNLQQLLFRIASPDSDTLDGKQWQIIIERHLLQLKRLNIDLLISWQSQHAIEHQYADGFQNDTFWKERRTHFIIIENPKPYRIGDKALVHIDFIYQKK